MSRARVVIGERDPATRAGLRLALKRADFLVEAECSAAPEVVEVVKRVQPDACLLDVGLPGDGIAAASEICAHQPSPAVLMLTEALDHDELLRVIRAGAVGYLQKDMSPERLPFAVDGVLQGEAAVPRILVGGLIDELRARRRRRSSPLLRERGVQLTNREWEVLELLEKGSTTAEIATALQVSPVTVRRHLGVALYKLGVEDRAGAVELMRELEPA